MKSLSLIVMLVAVTVAAPAQLWTQPVYAQSLADSDSATIATVVYLHEDGTPFAEAQSRSVMVNGQVYVFVVWTDSAMIALRMATDAALVKFRQAQQRPGTFNADQLTPQAREILNDMKRDLENQKK